MCVPVLIQWLFVKILTCLILRFSFRLCRPVSQTTFKFSSNLWTNQALHNIAGGLTGFDDSEAKLSTYHNLPFTQLCIVFRPVRTHQFGYVHLQTTVPQTLYSLIGNGRYRPTGVGRSTWLSAVPGSAIQANCNREGFNAVADYSHHTKARIGIIANNEDDCVTTDTALGVGLHSAGCGIKPDLLSAGSYKQCMSGRNTGHVINHAFAYVLAQ